MHFFTRPLLCLFFFSCLTDASAQKTEFGLFAGYQQTGAEYKVRSRSQETGNKYGFLGGFTARIPFEHPLYFTPSVFYSMKGYTVQLKDTANPPGIDAISNDVTMHTLDIAPLFNIDFSKNPSHFFIQVGPSFEFNISGEELIGYANGTQKERKMPFSFDRYSHMTTSIIGRLGYEWKKGFLVFAHYSYGLGDLNNADKGPSIHHRNYGISMGKYFRRK